MGEVIICIHANGCLSTCSMDASILLLTALASKSNCLDEAQLVIINSSSIEMIARYASEVLHDSGFNFHPRSPI